MSYMGTHNRIRRLRGAWGRVVVHDRDWYCPLPNPGADEPHAPVEHWRTARRRAA